MSGDHNQYQKDKSYLDFECPRCGHCCQALREKVAAWMMARGYATGHGDTVEDLLKELEWQISEKLTSNHTAPFVTDKRSDKTDTRKSWTA